MDDGAVNEREFQGKDLAYLEDVYARYPADEELAARLLEELAARRDKSPRARELRAKLMQLPGAGRFAGRDPSLAPESPDAPGEGAAPTLRADPRPGEVATIRPVGTAGLPIPKPETYDTTYALPIGPDASPAARYGSALEEYVKERRAARKGRRQAVRKGVRRSGEDVAPSVYEFVTSKTAGIAEGDGVELVLSDRSVEGSVRKVEGSTLVLELAADIGARVGKATLKLDDSKLLEKLRERIREMERRQGAGDGAAQFNVALANSVIGAGAAPRVAALDPRALHTVLNSSQLAAVSHVLAHPVTFIWGPPGCGKTLTLGEVVHQAFNAGKRVLVCSNTNKAVDQVVKSICETLGKQHPALERGEVVRLGVISDEELAENYGRLIDLDAIVQRRGEPLRQELEKVKAGIAAVEREQAVVRELLNRFAELDVAERKLDEAREEEQALELREVELEARIAATEQRMIELADELQRAQTGGLLGVFRRSVEAIIADMTVARDAHTAARSELGENVLLQEDARLIANAAEEDCEHLAAGLAGESREECEQKRRELNEKFAELKQERESLDRQLAELKASILREARVLGATATRTYLTPTEMGVLDLVIVDEASMLLQPLLWMVAGLSRERVVMCGDFRQLPPIIDTKKQAIFSLLGRDVFDVAGLTRLGARDERMVMLDTQYRMDPAICALIADRMYAGRLKTTHERQWRMERDALPRPPPPFDRALTLIDTSGLRPTQAFEGMSRFNPVHAMLVRNLAHHLTSHGFAKDPTVLGVCTPYREHAELIERVLKAESLDHVHAGTVHAFQGDEREVVIVDFPESPPGDIGRFLKGTAPEDPYSRSINVAVSRARRHLIIIANLAHLDARLPSDAILRGVLHDMQGAGAVLPGARLLAVGPRAQDLKGLEDIDLDTAARDIGVFTSLTFDSAFAADVRRARQSIAIFSGFVAKHRVAELQGLLRDAASEIPVRCVSRPPHINFPKDPESGAQAFRMLRECGCVVDGRSHIHQKTVIIDQRIVWNGSLNVLSFSHLTDEIMTRFVSAEAARSFAAALAKSSMSAEEAIEKIAVSENPPCGVCQRPSYYHQLGRAGEFRCEQRCQDPGALKSREEIATYLASLKRRPYPRQGPPCPECKAETWRKLNRKDQVYFYGCSRFGSHGCYGSWSIPAESPRAAKVFLDGS